MCNHDHMDTANLEHAARRYREAEAALDAARTDLQAEAIALLQTSERGTQATVVRITGWSREHLRRLKEKDETEALRRKVEELSATGPARPAAAPRRQSPPPKPEPTIEERPLSDDEAKNLAELARSRADDLQLRKLEQDTAGVADRLKDFAVVSSALPMGLLKRGEVYGTDKETTA